MTRHHLARALLAAFVGLLLLPAVASAQGGHNRRDTIPPTPSAPLSSRVQAAAVAASDQYEDDDSTAQARDITFWGGTEAHTVDAVGGTTWDYDYFKFVPVPGTLYIFETSGVSDTAIEIWDGEPYYATITWNDDIDALNGNMGSYISWRAPADAAGRTFYLCVGGANSVSGAGEYTIKASTVDNAPTTCTVKRLSGADRFAVAVAAAKQAFPLWQRADGAPVSTVVIANGLDAKAADPLAAASLAGIHHAPVLLVGSTSVPAITRSAINQIRTENGGRVNIIVIGGTGTVPATVYSAISALRGTGTCERISGADRYEIAAKITDKVVAYWSKKYGRAPWRVYVANGENPAAFYDAIAMGPILYREQPLLLVRTGSVPASTKARLSGSLKDAEVVVVNQAYTSAAVYSAVRAKTSVAYSTSRYVSAYLINRFALNHWIVPSVSYAVANKMADSLTGGSMMGELNGGLLYTPATALDGYTVGFLYWKAGSTHSGYVLGGPVSVNANVYSEFNYLLTTNTLY